MYEKDFYAWAIGTARLIRERKFNEIDLEDIAEEIESIGKSDKRALVSRFAALLAHLPKWQYQPERRGNSWKYTIRKQRLEVNEILSDSPSLKHELEKNMSHAYEKALLIALKETGLSPDTFPSACPFSLAQCLNQNFFPDGGNTS